MHAPLIFFTIVCAKEGRVLQLWHYPPLFEKICIGPIVKGSFRRNLVNALRTLVTQTNFTGVNLNILAFT